MNPCYCDPSQCPPHNQRKLVLRKLITLRNIGGKIILAVKLGEVRESSPERETNLEDMLHRLLVNHRKCTRVTHADGADVHIRSRLVRGIFGITEHLRQCLQLGMYLQSHCKNIVALWHRE